MLAQLPVDELKVDLGFVQRSAHSAPDEAIVRSIRDLAERLGLTAVAEGVETEECARRLERYGFDVLQGYHFGRPQDEDALLALVRTTTGLAVAPMSG
jgi:EAL domain-containing protein (putative c-di-GMP-specific phosphodiesterase class I)